MTICIDLTALADNLSGIERYAAGISSELIKFQDEKFILIFKGEVHPLFAYAKHLRNVQIIILKSCGKLFFNQIRLLQALKKVTADFYLFLAFPVPVLLRRKNMICAVHDAGVFDRPETMKFLQRLYFKTSYRHAAKKCGAIITISEFSAKRLIENLPLKGRPLWIIYCSAGRILPEGGSKGGYGDLSAGGYESIGKSANCGKDFCGSKIRKKYNIPEKYIFSLSTLEPRKNLKLLIDAYTELFEEGKIDIPLVLAGRSGWKTGALAQGHEKNSGAKVIFTGFVDDCDLPYLYAGAEFFVFPSLYEGFGIPPLEAMSFAAPVLSSDAASMPEVLNGAAVYFKSEDKEDLKKKILCMLSLNDAERQDLVKKGAERCELFSWKREAEKLMAHLR